MGTTSDALNQVPAALGGSVVGFLSYALYLFLTGKLRAQKTVDEQLTSKDVEIAYLKAKLDGAESYVKELVGEMNEQNETIRHEVLPNMTGFIQHIITERAIKHVDS